MLSRRFVLIAALATSCAPFPAAFAASPQAFDEKGFAEAQKAGKPILIAIHASWCPTCKVQKPILSELMADPKLKNMAYFVIDFDEPEESRDAVRGAAAIHAYRVQG